MYIAVGLYTNAKARLQIFSQRTNERSDFSHSIVKGAEGASALLLYYASVMQYSVCKLKFPGIGRRLKILQGPSPDTSLAAAFDVDGVNCSQFNLPSLLAVLQ